jgi:hypothetical protein
MKIYKYIKSKYIDSTVKKGIIRFNSLSYYKFIEDKSRKDDNEGKLIYKPKNGLELTFMDGKKLKLDGAFESSVNDDEIYIFCLSSELSIDLAKKFDTDCCIEIFKPDRFFAKINKEIKKNHYNLFPNKIFHNKVVYYDKKEPPLHNWALPQNIVLRKDTFFNTENEFRIFFSFNNALDFGFTEQKIVIEKQTINKNTSQPYEICIGNISSYCIIHKFDM